jgi:hypothetical protein
MKHIKVLQPFSIKITHNYKYISIYSLLSSVTPHTFPKELSIPTPNYKLIECHRNPLNPPSTQSHTRPILTPQE